MINRMECHRGIHCPYVNGGDIRRLIGERNYLSQRLDEMERLMAVAEAEIEKLRQENEELKGEREALRYELNRIQPGMLINQYTTRTSMPRANTRQ